MSAKKFAGPATPDCPPQAGLCAGCRHRRLQRGGRSLFIRCALAKTDPAFPRYPRLPVLLCDGFSRDSG